MDIGSIIIFTITAASDAFRCKTFSFDGNIKVHMKCGRRHMFFQRTVKKMKKNVNMQATKLFN